MTECILQSPHIICFILDSDVRSMFHDIVRCLHLDKSFMIKALGVDARMCYIFIEQHTQHIFIIDYIGLGNILSQQKHRSLLELSVSSTTQRADTYKTVPRML